jgi:hypothetical protein
MAKRANMFASHEQVGVREDLSDMIHNIDPTETPVVTAIGVSGEGGGNTLFDWQIDSLASPDSANAKIEGEDAAAAALGATTRLNNYHQISDKVYGVTGTSRVLNGAGRNDELDYQRLKKGVELRKDIEAVLTGIHQAKLAGNDSTARLTGNFASWITTNSTVGATGVKPTGDGTDVPTAGTPYAFTEAALQSTLQTAWTNGARPSKMFMPAAIKVTANGFTGRATAVNAVDTDTVVHAHVDVYVSEFGTVEMIPCRDIEANTIYGIDPEYAALRYLRNFETNELAKVGDSDREQMLVEYGLEVGNEAAHFAFYGVTA